MSAPWKRGTTYTKISIIRGWDLRTATEVVVSVKPLGRPSINIDKDHMSISSDGTDTTIAYRGRGFRKRQHRNRANDHPADRGYGQVGERIRPDKFGSEYGL